MTKEPIVNCVSSMFRIMSGEMYKLNIYWVYVCKNERMSKWMHEWMNEKYQEPFDLLLYSVVFWDLQQGSRKNLWMSYFSLFLEAIYSKNTWHVNPEMLPGFCSGHCSFLLNNNSHQKYEKETKRRLNSILSNVVKSWQLQERFYREEN